MIFKIWDRQDKEFKKFKQHQIDTLTGRHYFKYEGGNLWLEDGVALDVFVVIIDGKLLPFKDALLMKQKVKQDAIK